jgi:hypothetical protein
MMGPPIVATDENTPEAWKMMHKPFAGMPAAGETFEDVSVITYIRTNDHINALKEKY